MAKNYIKIISEKHPNTSASIVGDASIYSNIIWHDTPIAQVTLDSEYLDILKKERYAEIDQRTGELISNGFSYASKIFSLSENGQRNLLGAYSAKDALSYPVAWNTIDDSDTYDIVDAADMTNFFLTALSTKKTHQDSGTSLKTDIRNAVDEAGVNAVVDNR